MFIAKCRITTTRRRSFLVLLNQFSSEGNTHGTEEKSGILVSSSTGVDGNVTTGNHFGRVPECDTRVC